MHAAAFKDPKNRLGGGGNPKVKCQKNEDSDPKMAFIQPCPIPPDLMPQDIYAEFRENYTVYLLYNYQGLFDANPF